MGINAIALLWGFAEATFFFIVPDLWLTLVARDRLQTGLTACLYSLIGALVGGILIYLWGITNQQTAIQMIEAIPAISPEMVTRAHDALTDQGVVALLFGPLSGTPYKVYAAQAAQSSIGPGLFLLISIPARLIRFLLITLLAHYALKGVTSRWPGINKTVLLLVCWALFYGWYFSIMPG